MVRMQNLRRPRWLGHCDRHRRCGVSKPYLSAAPARRRLTRLLEVSSASMRVDRLMVSALVLLSITCGTEPSGFRVGCSNIESVEIGSGVEPRIGWEPGCSVATLDVYEAHPRTPGEDPVPPLPTEHPTHAAGTLMWAISSPDSLGNRLGTSVRYGVLPAGAVEIKAAAPLQDGQPYLVRVAVLDPDGFDAPVAWGLLTP